MEKDWSSAWKASAKPRKQRKFMHQAPPHIRQALCSARLAKELSAKHGTRNVQVRAGDTVKVMRGAFRGKTLKIEHVDRRVGKVALPGIETAKKDGSKVPVLIHPSNLLITELDLSDRKRAAMLARKHSPAKKK